jgi:hypothetical protein
MTDAVSSHNHSQSITHCHASRSLQMFNYNALLCCVLHDFLVISCCDHQLLLCVLLYLCNKGALSVDVHAYCLCYGCSMQFFYECSESKYYYYNQHAKEGTNCLLEQHRRPFARSLFQMSSHHEKLVERLLVLLQLLSVASCQQQRLEL